MWEDEKERIKDVRRRHMLLAALAGGAGGALASGAHYLHSPDINLPEGVPDSLSSLGPRVAMGAALGAPAAMFVANQNLRDHSDLLSRAHDTTEERLDQVLPDMHKLLQGDGSKLLDTRSPRALLTDMFLTHASAGRAGRATAISDMLEKYTGNRHQSFLTRNPVTSMAAFGVPAAAIAATPGLMNLSRDPEQSLGSFAGEALGTVGLPAILGGISGTALSGYLRNREMRRIKDEYERAKQDGSIPLRSRKFPLTMPSYSPTESAVLNLAAPHRTGWIEGASVLSARHPHEDARSRAQAIYMSGIPQAALSIANVPGVTTAMDVPANFKAERDRAVFAG